MASLHGVWTSFSGKFNCIFVSFKSHISREQRIPASRNANLIFIVFSLLSFLQIKSQGISNGDSPFLTHPKTCNLAIVSLLLYGLAYDTEQRYSGTHLSVANAARRAMGLFGSLLTASLASFLFPSWVQPLLYVFYVFYYADELIDWLQLKFLDEPEQMDIPPV